MSSETMLERIEAQLAAIREEVRQSRHITPAALSIKEAAEMLRCSPDHITKMVKNGKLRPRDLDGLSRIPVTQIYALLEEPQAKSSGATPERTRYDAAAASAKLAALRKRR